VRPIDEIRPHDRVLRVQIGEAREPTVLHARLVREVDRAVRVEPAGVRAVGQPGVARAEVVRHDVEHDLEALLVRLANELLELGHVAEVRIDLVGIEGPVAVVPALHLQRHWSDPDRGHPETLDVVELVDHTLKVTALPPIGPAGDAIEVVLWIAVAEAVRHHHVDRLVAPIDGRRSSRLRPRQQARDDDERREDHIHAGTSTAASRAPTVMPPLARFLVRRSTRSPSGRHTSVGKSPVLMATYISSRGGSAGASGPVDDLRYAYTCRSSSARTSSKAPHESHGRCRRALINTRYVPSIRWSCFAGSHSMQRRESGSSPPSIPTSSP